MGKARRNFLQETVALESLLRSRAFEAVTCWKNWLRMWLTGHLTSERWLSLIKNATIHQTDRPISTLITLLFCLLLSHFSSLFSSLSSPVSSLSSLSSPVHPLCTPSSDPFVSSYISILLHFSSSTFQLSLRSLREHPASVPWMSSECSLNDRRVLYSCSSKCPKGALWVRMLFAKICCSPKTPYPTASTLIASAHRI